GTGASQGTLDQSQVNNNTTTLSGQSVTWLAKVNGSGDNANCIVSGSIRVELQAKTAGGDGTQSGKWETTTPICFIAVKGGGGNDTHIYKYDPPVTSGTFTTDKGALSDIQFFTCPPTKGTINLTKTTTGPNGATVGANTFKLTLNGTQTPI